MKNYYKVPRENVREKQEPSIKNTDCLFNLEALNCRNW